MISASTCYLFYGPLLGVMLYASLLYRDSVSNTALYWLNPPNFSGPAEHFGSLVVINELHRNQPQISLFRKSIGLLYGLFAALLTGSLVGGFLVTGFLVVLGYKVQ